MVKFYSASFGYDYSFPAVSLAYFLRYPNPYSTHVESTDVIERSFDDATQRVTTVRLHLKKSKLPAAVLKILPRSLMGGSEEGDSKAYILERSVVDIKEGWMRTESRNLEWTGVLSVIESQNFKRDGHAIWDVVNGQKQITTEPERTGVTTTVALRSHIGENLRRRRARMAETAAQNAEDGKERMGFFKSWTTGSIQRSIEAIGLRRAEGAQPKAAEGMKVVLERLRQGGLVAVLDGMRKDRELMFASQAGPNFVPPPSGNTQPTITYSED
ncbi:PRELI-like family protein [Elsinoe australis]|uniref:PRELI-like family protein n=1 Tax=Elsinoe australis TaxID=40998 RepID=A0A4V6DTJ8_9PEZI|nr:PRELI-like family protein [Elsinoe australis]